MENKETQQYNTICGLTNEEVKERTENGLVNKSTKNNEKTIGQIVFHNVFTFFNTILIIIAITFLIFIIYLYSTGNAAVVDKHFGFSKFVFLIPAVMNITIGTIQEIHGKKVLDGLKIITLAKSRVLRDGKEETINADEIVMDDIVLLKAGEQATADFVLIEGYLQVDESNLTGESDYIKKYPGDKIFSGSSIIVGDAKVKTIAVGDDTFAQSISSKVKSMERHKSELMSKIMLIMKVLAVCLVVVTITIIVSMIIKIQKYGADASLWDGMEMSISDPVSWARIMITVGSFAVGIMPSGLVLTTSVTLVLSIASLSKKQTLIQELYSLENLSRVDVICLDKTGTLTDGTMKVCETKRFTHLEYIYDNIRNLLGVSGSKNQTAEALFNEFGENTDVEYQELIPFSSEHKSSGLIYKNGDKLLLGAPEYLLDKDDERLEFVNQKASEGKRVLAFKLNDELLAFFVIEDQIRKSAKDTLEFFKDNGVTVKVISGDNPLTVSKIAKTCGVENADKAISLEGVSLEDIPSLVEEYTIFARVSPEQKEAIVKALQEKKHKVAMTGDGVNDILALRRADSSITFAKATDAAKSVSDVVLMDNDFSHLKDVVAQGRRVIGNISRTSILFLMKSFAILFLAFALIPLKKGQMWYTIENAYMLESAVIGTGGFVLSLEFSKRPIKGSFTKNIIAKGIAAGLLAMIAIVISIQAFTLPYSLGYEPWIREENVKTMISILLTLSGLVVAFTMCLPFTKYRLFAFILIILTAVSLAFILPTSFVGGMPTNAAMFGYDSSKGQTVFDSRFMHEFMQPWNSIPIQNLFSDKYNFIILGIFVFAALPIFFGAIEFINKKILKNDDGIIDQFINDPKRLTLKEKKLEWKKARIETKQRRIAERLKNKK
ncbi:MAG: HAD-IC family P-type ATPase [Acholeplasmatales bacterium]|nr:HAD-IC family P-type ATPase [Acholeplasmatales bacterium]